LRGSIRDETWVTPSPLKDCPAWRVWGTRRGGVCPMRKGTQTLSHYARPGHCGAKRNLQCCRENTAPEVITDYRGARTGGGGEKGRPGCHHDAGQARFGLSWRHANAEIERKPAEAGPSICQMFFTTYGGSVPPCAYSGLSRTPDHRALCTDNVARAHIRCRPAPRKVQRLRGPPRQP
jgi:hypothetical protein